MIFELHKTMSALAILFILSLTTNGQVLKNSEWVNVRTQHTDGSKSPNFFVTTYIFLDHQAAMVSYGAQQEVFHEFVTANGELYIGKLRFSIQTNGDSALTLTEVPLRADTKVDRHWLINSKYYVGFLEKYKIVDLNSDTLVAGPFLYPTMDLNKFIREKWGAVRQTSSVTCSFVVSADGSLSSVVVSEQDRMSEKDVAKVKRLLLATQRKWSFPYGLTKPFKVNIKISFLKVVSLSGVNVSFLRKNPSKPAVEP